MLRLRNRSAANTVAPFRITTSTSGVSMSAYTSEICSPNSCTRLAMRSAEMRARAVRFSAGGAMTSVISALNYARAMFPTGRGCAMLCPFRGRGRSMKRLPRMRAFASGVAVLGVALLGALHPIPALAAVTEFPLQSNAVGPNGLTLGPDGNIWVAESDANLLASVTPSGVVTAYDAPNPYGVAVGPDGNVWFTESLGDKVGRITPSGTITEFTVPNAAGKPHPRGIAAGVDGRIWIAEDDGRAVYSLTTFGTFSAAYPIASASCTPFQMTVAADGSVWFIENIPGNVAKVETGPGAPTATAAPGKGSATVTWTAPLNGGTPITGFTIDTYKGTTLAATTNAAANALSASISGLANGTVYSFKVTAANAIGTGPPTTTRRITVGMVELSLPSGVSSPYYMTAGDDGRVWFTEADSNNLGASLPCGLVVEYPVPTASSFPYGIASGPDHNLWFTELTANQIGRGSVNGSMAEFGIPTPSSLPEGIAAGADGAIWFTERGANKIGRITTAGSVTNEIAIPTASSYAEFIAAGPDNAMWFTERDANQIGRISLSSPFTITEFAITTSSSGPQGIVLGPDGALWFTESQAAKVGRITTSGVFTEFPIPGSLPLAREITVGSDGAMWFAEDNRNALGRITLAGGVSDFPVTTQAAGPRGVASLGSQVWFTENLAGKIGNMPAAGNATMPFPLFHPRAGVCQSVGGTPQARPSVNPVPAQTPRPR